MTLPELIGDTKAHPGRGSYQLLQSDVMKLKEPEFITARMIAKHTPCDEQFKEFKRLFPNGVETTEEALKKVAEAGLDAWWLVKKFELTVKTYWFCPDGSIKRESHYLNGKLNDPSPDIPASKGFYPDGSIAREEHYRNGKLNDPSPDIPASKGFYPNGSIKWEEHYRNGKLNDPSPDIPAIKGFYPNGSIRWEVHYLNGEFISQKFNPKE